MMPAKLMGNTMKAGCAGMLLTGLSAGLSGCISVTAPEKPIVIELNINIKQEVVYKLDKGVQDMIDKNAGIF